MTLSFFARAWANHSLTVTQSVDGGFERMRRRSPISTATLCLSLPSVAALLLVLAVWMNVFLLSGLRHIGFQLPKRAAASVEQFFLFSRLGCTYALAGGAFFVPVLTLLAVSCSLLLFVMGRQTPPLLFAIWTPTVLAIAAWLATCLTVMEMIP